ncbi:hypothetical protein ACFCV3_02290 [Kribbella sp. NPDC056345]|uniref:hypothetical protein n=1 Tax=Kribbella sp. NPDC056345 TaxID=3345789 RepID=UPI0035D5DB94
MTETVPQVGVEVRRPGGLLLIALVPLAAFMGLAHLTVDGSAGAMTAAQVDARALPWMVVAVLWIAPVMLAAFAFRAIGGRMVRLPAAMGIGLSVAYVAAQAGVVWIDQAERLADSSLLPLAILLSLLAWWAVDVAAVLTCLRLAKNSRTALVIGVLTAVFLVLEVAIYLPALIGGQKLVDTVGLPPMVLPVLWAVLGWSLRRRGSRLHGR